jgi:hypothetical protein
MLILLTLIELYKKRNDSMSRALSIKYGTTVYNMHVNEFPDKCGQCHKNVDPALLGASFVKGDNTSLFMEVAFQCTNLKCNSLILGYFSREKYPGDFKLMKIAPVYPMDKGFDEEIKNISNNFVMIYNQSFHAEQIGLTMIAGIGYRKALEFLIKDYLIYLAAENEEIILKAPLSQCINQLENNTLKEIAKRATWIGNDEAHYQRIWVDKDVADLKRLIDITVHFIAMEVSSKRYLQEMSN